MDHRIIELALEALKSRKAAIDEEIEDLQAELRSLVKPSARKSQSERMKAYWARKRAESAKLSAAQAPKTVVRRRRPRSAAQKKAQSERMKAYWAKRRADVPKKK
jgi:hypothetical protein